jgi:hypothetical protein
MRTLFLASTVFVLGLSSTASAHFVLNMPAPSKPSDASGGKGAPPCGPDGTPAATPVAVQGGHNLHIDINETTYHPGWYRIALGVNGRGDLPVDPKVYDAKGAVLDPAKGGVNSVTAEKQPDVFPILAGAAWDHKTNVGHFMMDLPIPNFDCPKCVLQIGEFMAEHGSNVGIGGFFYHHCADLKITADPALPAFVAPGADGGASDAGSAKDATADTGSTGAAGTTGAAGNGAAGTTGAAGSGATAGTGGPGTAGTSGAAGSNTGAAGTSGAAGVGAAGTGTATGAAGTSGAAGTTGTAGRDGGGGGGCSIAGSTNAQAGLALILLGTVVAIRRRRVRRRR